MPNALRITLTLALYVVGLVALFILSIAIGYFAATAWMALF